MDCRRDAVLEVDLVGIEWVWSDKEGVAKVWEGEYSRPLNLQQHTALCGWQETDTSTHFGPMFSAVLGEIILLAGGRAEVHVEPLTGGEGEVGPLLAGRCGEVGSRVMKEGVQERENRGGVGLAVVKVWSRCLMCWTYNNASHQH